MASERTRRDRWITFLLLPAVVIAVLVLTGGSFRTSFQLEKLRDQSVLEATLELANERAQRLDQLIVEQDNIVSAEFNASDLSEFGGSWLSIAQRQTPTVRAVLVIDLDSPKREVLLHTSRAPGPDDAVFRRLLVYRVLDDVALDEAQGGELHHLHRSYSDQSYLISYWRRQLSGRSVLLVAWHDVARIVHDYLPWLYSERDSQSRVNVVDAAGRIVFGPPLSGGEFTVGLPFQTTLYKWRLNVALTSAAELAQRAARRRVIEMVLVGLSSLVVIAGIVLIMVAVARERKLSNLKSDFVANVSHELKTPLSLVRMFGELLQTGRVEDEQKRQQYVRIIVNESERLGMLIENVLDFAKVERGKAAYDFELQAVGEAVVRAVDVCRVRAERQSVELEVRVPDFDVEAEIDARAVEVAVINLVDNALKYAPDSEQVRVELRVDDEFAVVRVVDQGPGIPAEDRKRIFERFERGSKRPQIRGSGIGLALVLHIARAHGGDAWVDTGSAKGSCFAFSIKLPKATRRLHLRPSPAATA